MEFQYDPQRRRHTEGWNIIIYDGEDKIGLTADEYNEIAFDFEMNSMNDMAIRSYKRGIALGSQRSMALLGALYFSMKRWEEAYTCLLEASLAEDAVALEYLAKMYRGGIYVRQDDARAETLEQLAIEKLAKEKNSADRAGGSAKHA